MHVASRLNMTVSQLYNSIESPEEITEWLTFFGNPHLDKLEQAKKKPKQNRVTNEDFRSWVRRHNERVQNGGKTR